MKQNRKEFSSYFSRSIKQNKPLYLLLMSSETNPFPRPVGVHHATVQKRTIGLFKENTRMLI